MPNHMTEGLCLKAAELVLGWGTGNSRLIRATWLIQIKSSCTDLVWYCPTDDAEAAETVASARSEYLEIIKVYGEKQQRQYQVTGVLELCFLPA